MSRAETEPKPPAGGLFISVVVHAALLVCQGSLARLQPAQALESTLVQ